MGRPSKRTKSYVNTARERRQRQQRLKNPCFFLVTEGDSEEIYFKHFSSRQCRVKLFVAPSGDPKGLVMMAKSLIQNGAIDVDPDQDELWCVFDRDDNSQSAINEAIEIAKENSFKIAFSNPCFEIWLLWHFKETFSHRENSQSLPKELEPFLGEYKKTEDYFDRLLPHIDDAISRAKRAKKKHLQEGKGEFTRDFNPSSNIYEIIEGIKKNQAVDGS
ncbi:MAG: RloB domain-containing protein [Angelakisella sp.]|jgi:hypothetical protein|nr:RloB domain-containing protein [Angelakisella sp.]